MPSKKDIKVIKYIGNRFKERSTWLGLFTMLALFGVTPTPELVESVSSVGAALVASLFSVLSITVPDSKNGTD